MNITPGAPAARAFAQYYRAIADASLELAKALETAGESRPRSLDMINLGSLQRQVAEAPGMDSGEGVSPREITRSLGRDDEPNIRTALARLKTLEVAELVPGPGPQRWRLTSPYRDQQ
jgi:hypothetical protein